MLAIFRSMFLCLLLSFPCFAKVYHFNSIQNLAEQEIGAIILYAIYQKLGLDIVIHPLPGKRAQLEVKNGTADGEIMRIWTYGQETPSSIRVPTPYYYLETTAFVKKNSGIIISSRDDLKKYRLAKVLGVKHTNNITEGMTNVYDLASTENMMNFLLSGRADVALTNTIDGLLVLKKMNNPDIVPSGTPLETLNLFHYIHKKHRTLVPKVDGVIQEMIATGELQDLIHQAEEEVVGK